MALTKEQRARLSALDDLESPSLPGITSSFTSGETRLGDEPPQLPGGDLLDEFDRKREELRKNTEDRLARERAQREAAPDVQVNLPTVQASVSAPSSGPRVATPEEQSHWDKLEEEESYWDKFTSGFSEQKNRSELEIELAELLITPTIDNEEIERREGAYRQRHLELAQAPENESWLPKNISAFGGILGGMEPAAERGAVTATVAAAGSAAVSAATGPYAPAVVGASALTGFGYGMTQAWALQGAGAVYLAQRERGVSVATARLLAASVGPAYAAVERLQAGRIVKALPGGQKLRHAIANTVADKTAEAASRVLGAAVKTKVGRFATDLTVEQAQEITQEGIQLAAQDVGVILDQGLDSPNRVTYQEAGRAVTEILSITGAMAGVLGTTRAIGLGGRGVTAGINRRRETENLKVLAGQLTEENLVELGIDPELSTGGVVRALRKKKSDLEKMLMGEQSLGDTGPVISEEEQDQLRYELQRHRKPDTGEDFTTEEIEMLVSEGSSDLGRFEQLKLWLSGQKKRVRIERYEDERISFIRAEKEAPFEAALVNSQGKATGSRVIVEKTGRGTKATITDKNNRPVRSIDKTSYDEVLRQLQYEGDEHGALVINDQNIELAEAAVEAGAVPAKIPEAGDPDVRQIQVWEDPEAEVKVRVPETKEVKGPYAGREESASVFLHRELGRAKRTNDLQEREEIMRGIRARVGIIEGPEKDQTKDISQEMYDKAVDLNMGPVEDQMPELDMGAIEEKRASREREARVAQEERARLGIPEQVVATVEKEPTTIERMEGVVGTSLREQEEQVDEGVGAGPRTYDDSEPSPEVVQLGDGLPRSEQEKPTVRETEAAGAQRASGHIGIVGTTVSDVETAGRAFEPFRNKESEWTYLVLRDKATGEYLSVDAHSFLLPGEAPGARAVAIARRGDARFIENMRQRVSRLKARTGASDIVVEVVHNHPGGKAEPSPQDLASNVEFVKLLDKIEGVEFGEHTIIDTGEATAIDRDNNWRMYDIYSNEDILTSEQVSEGGGLDEGALQARRDRAREQDPLYGAYRRNPDVENLFAALAPETPEGRAGQRTSVEGIRNADVGQFLKNDQGRLALAVVLDADNNVRAALPFDVNMLKNQDQFKNWSRNRRLENGGRKLLVYYGSHDTEQQLDEKAFGNLAMPNIQSGDVFSAIYVPRRDIDFREAAEQAAGVEPPKSAVDEAGPVTMREGARSLASDVDYIPMGDPKREENFQRWFGESKVADSGGKPLRVFHGTKVAGFDFFDTYGSRFGLFGDGSYFTEDPAVGSTYAKVTGESPGVYSVYLSIKNPIDMDQPADLAKWENSFGDVWGSVDEELPSAVKLLKTEGLTDSDVPTNAAVFLALKSAARHEMLTMQEGREMIMGGLEDMGYDGVTYMGGGYTHSGVSHQAYIAWHPEQVKSAIGNRGTFDPNDPSIVREDVTSLERARVDYPGEVSSESTEMRDEYEPPFFYNPLFKVLDEKMSVRARKKDVLGILKKVIRTKDKRYREGDDIPEGKAVGDIKTPGSEQVVLSPGVKQEQLVDTKFEEWLEGQPDVVTKEDVLAYVKEATPKVSETVIQHEGSPITSERWGVYDPSGGMHELYDTEAEAEAAADEMVEGYKSDWEYDNPILELNELREHYDEEEGEIFNVQNSDWVEFRNDSLQPAIEAWREGFFADFDDAQKEDFKTYPISDIVDPKVRDLKTRQVKVSELWTFLGSVTQRLPDRDDADADQSWLSPLDELAFFIDDNNIVDPKSVPLSSSDLSAALRHHIDSIKEYHAEYEFPDLPNEDFAVRFEGSGELELFNTRLEAVEARDAKWYEAINEGRIEVPFAHEVEDEAQAGEGPDYQESTLLGEREGYDILSIELPDWEGPTTPTHFTDPALGHIRVTHRRDSSGDLVIFGDEPAQSDVHQQAAKLRTRRVKEEFERLNRVEVRPVAEGRIEAMEAQAQESVPKDYGYTGIEPDPIERHRTQQKVDRLRLFIAEGKAADKKLHDRGKTVQKARDWIDKLANFAGAEARGLTVDRSEDAAPPLPMERVWTSRSGISEEDFHARFIKQRDATDAAKARVYNEGLEILQTTQPWTPFGEGEHSPRMDSDFYWREVGQSGPGGWRSRAAGTMVNYEVPPEIWAGPPEVWTMAKLDAFQDELSNEEAQSWDVTNGAERELRELLAQHTDKDLVGDLPFKRSWADLFFKRALAYAVEQDAEYLAWPSKQEQIEQIQGWPHLAPDAPRQRIVRRLTEEWPRFAKKHLSKVDKEATPHKRELGVDDQWGTPQEVWAVKLTDKVREEVRDKGQSLYEEAAPLFTTRVAASLKPGKLGVTDGTSYTVEDNPRQPVPNDELNDFKQLILKPETGIINPSTGKIVALEILGINHRTEEIEGSWEGREPSVLITLPNSNDLLAEFVASLFGDAFDQQAMAIDTPKLYTPDEVNALPQDEQERLVAGVVLTKEDGAAFSDEEMATIDSAIDPKDIPNYGPYAGGLHYSLISGRRELKLLNFTDLDEADFLADVSSKIKGAISAKIQGRGYASRSYLHEAEEEQVGGTEPGDRYARSLQEGGFYFRGGPGRSNIYRGLIDNLYGPYASSLKQFIDQKGWAPRLLSKERDPTQGPVASARLERAISESNVAEEAEDLEPGDVKGKARRLFDQIFAPQEGEAASAPPRPLPETDEPSRSPKEVPDFDPPPGVEERRFPQSLERAGLVAPVGEARYYMPQSNLETRAKVEKVFDKEGLAGLLRMVGDDSAEPSAERTAAGIFLHAYYMDKAMQERAANNDEEADVALERAVDIATLVSARLTRAGQETQAASMIGMLTPESIGLYVQRRIDKINERHGFDKGRKQKKKRSLTEDLYTRFKTLAGKAQVLGSIGVDAEQARSIADDLLEGKPLTPDQLAKIGSYRDRVKQHLEGDIAEEDIGTVSEQAPKVAYRNALRLRVGNKAADARERLRSQDMIRGGIPVDAMADLVLVGVDKMLELGEGYKSWEQAMKSELAIDISSSDMHKLYNDSMKAYAQDKKEARREYAQLKKIDEFLEKMAADPPIRDAKEVVAVVNAIADISTANEDARIAIGQEVEVMLRRLEPKAFTDYLTTILHIGRLLAFKTAERNIIGNQLMWYAERVTMMTAASIDRGVSLVSGTDRTIMNTPLIRRYPGKSKLFTPEDFIRGKGWWSFLSPELREGIKAGYQGVSPRGLPTQADLPQGLTFDTLSEDYKRMGRVRQAGFRGLRVLEGAMSAELRGFDFGAYMRAYNVVLYEEALLKIKNEGLTFDDRETRDAWINNWTSGADESILTIADEYARYVTFQDDTVLSGFTTKLKSLLNLDRSLFSNKWQKARDKVPVKSVMGGEYVMAYPKVPANLINRGLAYTPAGVLKSIREIGSAALKMEKGGGTRREGIIALSRSLVGSGAGALVYHMAKLGLLSGGEEEEWKVEDLKMQTTGEGRYRFNVSATLRYFGFGGEGFLREEDAKYRGKSEDYDGDLLMSYDWAQPLSMAAAFFVNAQEYTEREQRKEGPRGEGGLLRKTAGGLESGLRGSLHVIEEQPMMTGVRDLFRSYRRTESGFFEGAMRVLSNVPAGFVPQLVNQVKQYRDDTSRITYVPDNFAQTAVNKLIYRLPFVSETLPKMYKTLGANMPRKLYAQGDNSFFQTFFSPWFATRYNPDPVALMLLEPFQKAGETGQIPRRQSPTLKIGGITLTLTTEDRSQMQRVMGAHVTRNMERFVDGKVMYKVSNRARRVAKANRKIASTEEEQLQAMKDIVSQSSRAAKDWFILNRLDSYRRPRKAEESRLKKIYTKEITAARLRKGALAR